MKIINKKEYHVSCGYPYIKVVTESGVFCTAFMGRKGVGGTDILLSLDELNSLLREAVELRNELIQDDVIKG